MFRLIEEFRFMVIFASAGINAVRELLIQVGGLTGFTKIQKKEIVRQAQDTSCIIRMNKFLETCTRPATLHSSVEWQGKNGTFFDPKTRQSAIYISLSIKKAIANKRHVENVENVENDRVTQFTNQMPSLPSLIVQFPRRNGPKSLVRARQIMPFFWISLARRQSR